MATVQEVNVVLGQAGWAGDVVAVRAGSDGRSAVAVVVVGAAGRIQNELVGLGYSVSVEDSENPAYSSLRIR